MPRGRTWQKPKRLKVPRELLYVPQILQWADAHHRRTEAWPGAESGPILDTDGETWLSVENALRRRGRGIAHKSTLAQLLAEHRGVRNQRALPTLTVAQILEWADAHHERTGDWPNGKSGEIPDSNGESWQSVLSALHHRLRGLQVKSSIAKLLETRRGVRNMKALPELTVAKILEWADAHHERTGAWPNPHSGEVPGTNGETWSGVQNALRTKSRGLSKQWSGLMQLLQEHRAVRNPLAAPALTIDQILRWVDAHRQRVGAWPNQKSGPVDGVAGETWVAIDGALSDGRRGLPGGSSLAKLLMEHRQVRDIRALPLLRVADILQWARAYRRRTGGWPSKNAGSIEEAPTPGETWRFIDTALRRGQRGLPGGSSLSLLLQGNRRK